MNREAARTRRRQRRAAIQQSVKGRVIYLLVSVLVIQFLYPITGGNSTAGLVVYNLLYVAMLAAGIWVLADSRSNAGLAAGAAAIYLLFAGLYAFDPTSRWKILATYVALLPFQVLVLRMLVRFIFTAPAVTRDVLYAATTVYLLLGAVFVPVYGVLETLAPFSIIDGQAPDVPVHWQQLVYFSYVTISTAGYGDVLPVSLWARSLATLEAVAGVLYIAITLGRIVGLYSQEES